VEISTASKTIDVPFWKRNHRKLHCPDDFRTGVNRDFSPGSSHKKSPAKSVGLRD
jgi:hypothetical protein